jgi:hypothetical protein
MSSAYEYLGRVLSVDPQALEHLDKDMAERTGRAGVMDELVAENEKRITETLHKLNHDGRTAPHMRSIMRKTIVRHEKQLLSFLDTVEGKDEFDKAAHFSRRIANVGKGLFLKKEFGADILRARRPDNLLAYLKLDSVDALLQKHDVTEIFSALRFMESDEWMHQTFKAAYSSFTAADFEERDIEIKVLGPEWHEVSKKFVEKKHHNVSHLKEFGIIFLNPISENIPGKFLRDFALLLHYFHEIEFYSKLFQRYAGGADFAERLKSLLRGDVPEKYEAAEGEWLIVQRYLWKVNPEDPRLFLPRVNPEAMHWARGERDLTAFGHKHAKIDLELWHDLDWVGCPCSIGQGDIVSFDLEDNAMGLVSFMEGKPQAFNYHQREAMWTKLFEQYAGGEAQMEKLLLENYDKGTITFNS